MHGSFNKGPERRNIDPDLDKEWQDILATINAGEAREPVFESITLDPKASEVRSSVTGRSEHLSRSEFQILWMLVRAKGLPVQEKYIERFRHNEDPDSREEGLSNSFSALVAKVRRKLERVSDNAIHIPHKRGSGGVGYGYVLERKSPSA